MSNEKTGDEGAPRPSGPSLESAETSLTNPPADSPSGEEPSEEENEESSESATESDSDNKKRNNKRRDRRVRALNRRLARAEEERDAVRQQVADLQRRIDEMAEGARREAKPQRDGFDSDEDFAEAYSEWKTRQAKAKAEPPKPAPATSARELSPESLRKWIDKGREAHGDRFQAALGVNEAAITTEMSRYIVRSDQGHELYMALTEKPELAQEIADLSDDPFDLADAMKDLESELRRGRARDGQGRFVRESKQSSSAPRPTPKPERSRPAPAGDGWYKFRDSKDLGPSDVDDYMKKRRRDLLEKQGRIPLK